MRRGMAAPRSAAASPERSTSASTAKSIGWSHWRRCSRTSACGRCCENTGAVSSCVPTLRDGIVDRTLGSRPRVEPTYQNAELALLARQLRQARRDDRQEILVVQRLRDVSVAAGGKNALLIAFHRQRRECDDGNISRRFVRLEQARGLKH